MNNPDMNRDGLNQVEGVITHYEQALAIARETGDRDGEASHGWNLGLLYEEMDPGRAAALMQVCVDFEREIGHPNAEKDAAWMRAIRAEAAEEETRRVTDENPTA